MAGYAILDFVADDAQLIHMRVLDGKTEGRKRQWSNVEFARRERGNDRRRAFEPRGFRDIGAAEVGQQLFFLENQRSEGGRYDHPTDADLEGSILGTRSA